VLYKATGNFAAAEPLCRQAVEIKRVALGESHPDFATSLNNLAMLYEATGNFAAAEPLYRQALEIDRVALGESHPDFATTRISAAGKIINLFASSMILGICED
jgi:tetratricopeptide (TPR) repeat protein